MSVYTFGAYRIDSDARHLWRGQDRVPLSERHFDILLCLVSHPAEIVSKDALIDAGWHDVAVTDNSIEQAISSLRRVLGDAGGQPLIETVPRRGYRFAADVVRSAPRASDASLDALLAPHRAWLEGQTALETLEREQVSAARDAFLRAVQLAPDVAPIHIGLANACAFQFESTRFDVSPDAAALARAAQHAREACRLAPGLAEAWATLGFVLSRAGGSSDAIAAARRAVSIEPDNWRHQLRLALVAWGEERLRAATRTLQLLPGLGLAHFLASTVHVARQAFDRAERELESGAAAQDAQRGRPSRFTAVGLHWLRGLVMLRAGDEAGARASFDAELSFEHTGHLYTRECCAQVHYALGALSYSAGDHTGAVAAFNRALSYASGHVMALAALAELSDAGVPVEADAKFAHRVDELRAHGFGVDAAAASGLRLSLAGDRPAAAACVHDALTAAVPGSQGWMLPIDPLLRVSNEPQVWAGVLALLRAGAA